MSNKIYEIAQMVGNNNVIKGDMQEAAGIIRTMLAEKYVLPLNRIIEQEGIKRRENPSKEVRLLQAIRPFMPYSRQEQLSKSIDMLYNIETAKSLSTNISSKSQKPLKIAEIDNSVHPDGVYDIDKNCMDQMQSPSISPIFLILALLNSR